MLNSKIDINVVINQVEPEDDFKSILSTIQQNIGDWQNRSIIWNMNRFDFGNLNANTLRAFIQKGEKIATARAGLKTAIVIESDLGFGMMQMLRLMAETRFKFDIGVFRYEKEALDWIKLPPETETNER